MEIWKDVNGYDGIYQVSNYGNVRKLKTWVGNQYSSKYVDISPVPVNMYIDNKGYKRLCLSYNGKYTHVRLHRLVAQAFIPNPNNLPEVNHKDEDKFNNCVHNLEWCTHQYNTLYGTRVERIRLKNLELGSSRKGVVQYSLSGDIICEWNSLTEASKSLSISLSKISNCCHHKRKTAGGYIWKFKEDIICP